MSNIVRSVGTVIWTAFAWLVALAMALLVSLPLAACSPVAGANSMADAASSSSGAASRPASPASPSVSAGEPVSPFAASSSGVASAGASFELGDVAPYAGEASAEVNGNVPYFTAEDLARGSFEEYSPLDALGRCGVAFALVGPETMPVEERGSIGMVKPSGWHTVRYDGLVDGNYLYNRCHLIGYQLTGENANERNLITGTRTMNVVGMLDWEDRVESYVERTGNHVLYRSTPVFEGDELVARGVLLEAESVEDVGAGLRFCVWCYNVEPGVEIDYATGESELAQGAEGAAAVGSAESAEAASEPAAAAEATDVRTYVLNTNTRKFHYPDCSSVRDMAEHNKKIVDSTRDQVIADGYDPCKRCNP